jgi:hypothetical protein
LLNNFIKLKFHLHFVVIQPFRHCLIPHLLSSYIVKSSVLDPYQHFKRRNTLTDLKKILSYIPYFEDKNIEFCTYVTPELGALGYYQYDKKLTEFINELYKTDLLVGDYLQRLEEVESEDFKLIIPSANLELLKAILTFFVRAERFSEGTWRTAAYNKIFLDILIRFKELTKE